MKILALLLKIISAVMLIFSWVFIMVNFNDLPESVPIHYGFDGKPDIFGSKNINWFLLVIQSGIFFLLLYFSKNPEKPGLNIPKNLKENKKAADFIVSSLLFLMMLIFGLISYESTLNGLNEINRLSPLHNYLLFLLLVWIIGILIWSFLLSKRKKINS